MGGRVPLRILVAAIAAAALALPAAGGGATTRMGDVVPSAVSVAHVSAYSATLSWTTSAPATGVVEYGTRTSYGLWQRATASTTRHTVTLTNLPFGTTIHFRIRSHSGNATAASADATFRTLPLPATPRTTRISPSKQFLLDGHPFFPIMQWVQCPSLIPAEVALGIDVFMGNGCTGSDSSYLATARQNNALAVLPYDGAVKSDPALIGWNGPDEPDGRSITPGQIASQFGSNRAHDPDHVNLLTLTANFFSRLKKGPAVRDTYRRYAAAADFPGFDLYPIYGYCRPDWISWEADATREWNAIYSPSKAGYSWIEAASTSSQWCKGRGVEPQELRAEVWMTIANGSKGFGYFTHSWSPTYSQFRVSNAVQAEMQRTDRVVTNFTQPLLAAPARVSAHATTPGGRVDFVARSWHGATYVFAVNVGRTPVSAAFSGGALSHRTVSVFEEDRTIAASAAGFVDRFGPLAVHIYVVPPAGVS
jgi:hypothetical protein